MEQLLIGRAGTNTTNARYTSVGGGQAWQSSILNAAQVVSAPGVIKELEVYTSVAPGGATSFTITLRVNEVNTALSVTITGAATSGIDAVNSVNVVPGDRLSFGFFTGGGIANGERYFSCIFDGTNAKESLLLLNTNVTNTLVDTFLPYVGANRAHIITFPLKADMVIPTAGVLSDLYVDTLGTAPGGGGSYTLTIYRNTIIQALSCTVTDPATTASDVVNSVAVSPGDRIHFLCHPNGATNAVRMGIGLKFKATTDGEFIFAWTDSNPLYGATAYVSALDGLSVSDAVYTNRRQLARICNLYNLYLSASGALGGTWIRITNMVDANPTALTATITAPATTASDLVNVIALPTDLSMTCHRYEDSGDIGGSPIITAAMVGNFGSAPVGGAVPRGSNAAKLLDLDLI